MANPNFWGEQTATIDWCEENNVHSPYIVETFNTLSSLSFCVLGALDVYMVKKMHEKVKQFGGQPEIRFIVLFWLVIVIGAGSAAFHGTLLHESQQADETPMVLGFLSWAYVLWEPAIPKGSFLTKFFPPFLFLYGAVFAFVHWHYRFTTGFQVHFGTLVFFAIMRLVQMYTQVRKKDIRTLVQWYIQIILIGFSCWMADLHLCENMKNLPVNPQGHALWHLIMSLSTHFGPVAALCVRCEQLKWEYIVEWKFGFYPWVKVLSVQSPLGVEGKKKHEK